MTPSCTLPVLLVIISRALEQGVTACSGGTRSILTFNSDLSPSSHGYDQRKSVVPRALAEHAHAGDFVCLQEVWLVPHFLPTLQKKKRERKKQSITLYFVS